jgi:hypothetical protein
MVVGVTVAAYEGAVVGMTSPAYGDDGTVVGATVPITTGTVGATVMGTTGTVVGATVLMTTGTVVIGVTVGVTKRGPTVPLTGVVVGSRTEILTGVDVIGGRVAFDFSGCLVAGRALDPLLVGTGVAMFELLADGIGVGTEGIGVGTDVIGNPDVTLKPTIVDCGDVVKMLGMALPGAVVDGLDMLLGGGDVLAAALFDDGTGVGTDDGVTGLVGDVVGD